MNVNGKRVQKGMSGELRKSDPHQKHIRTYFPPDASADGEQLLVLEIDCHRVVKHCLGSIWCDVSTTCTYTKFPLVKIVHSLSLPAPPCNEHIFAHWVMEPDYLSSKDSRLSSRDSHLCLAPQSSLMPLSSGANSHERIHPDCLHPPCHYCFGIAVDGWLFAAESVKTCLASGRESGRMSPWWPWKSRLLTVLVWESLARLGQHT